MCVHVARKNEEDPIKSEGTGVVTTFLPFLFLFYFLFFLFIQYL